MLCRYAWFAPRTYDFDWIGPSASLLLADQPVLTSVGALYTGAPNSAGSRSHAPASASGLTLLAPDAAAQPSQAPAVGGALQTTTRVAAGAAPAADLSAAGGAAGAAARGRADKGLAGGTWRGLCRVCDDQAAGLGALPAPERGARVQQCHACGYWNYGSGQHGEDAGTPRSGKAIRGGRTRSSSLHICIADRCSKAAHLERERSFIHVQNAGCTATKHRFHAAVAGAWPAMLTCSCIPWSPGAAVH